MRSIRNRSRLAPLPGSLLLLSVAATVAPVAVASSSDIDPEATRLLERSTSYLARQERFTVDTHSTLEVVLETGQKIQFDHAVSLSLQRPNKLRAERFGDLVDQVFYYDGTSLTLHNPDDGYYATIPAPDTLEGMLDFAREKLNIVAPAGDLVYQDAYDILMEDVTSAIVVGKSAINGIPCDHLAFRKDHVDWQIWIQQGVSPVPRRLVITSRDLPEAPQFTVEMRHWDLAPVLTDDLFMFAPTPGAQEIDFLTIERSDSSSQ